MITEHNPDNPQPVAIHSVARFEVQGEEYGTREAAVLASWKPALEVWWRAQPFAGPKPEFETIWKVMFSNRFFLRQVFHLDPEDVPEE